MAEEKKKTTPKKKTTSTKKSSSSKKTTSTVKKTNTTKKSSTSKPKTTTKKTSSSSASKTKSTSTKKSTSTMKSTNTKAKTTTKKTTPKKATTTPKKVVKKEVKPVVEEPFEYTNSYTLTDIFGKHKKEEPKIKPEDVVFEDDKKIVESNLSVEEQLDKVLNESPIEDIPVEKEEIVEEHIEVKEEIKDKPIVIEERVFGREERTKKIVRKRKLKNWVYIALISIFALIIIFSIFKLVTHKPLNDQLNERYVNVLDGGYKEFDIDFNGLKKLNKDTVGYVKLNATTINHVVVKGKDNKYYKNNNFLKRKGKNGWIYMDSRNKLDGTDKHLVIYGSNNKDIFGSLDKVLTDKWQKKKEYHYITYVSENFENRYEVFSTYEADKADIKVDFNKQVDYDKYIKKIKSKSEYNYNVEVNSYDNILTLVSYDGNKQIIVHAKLIK